MASHNERIKMLHNIAMMQRIISKYNELPSFENENDIHKAIRDIPEWVQSLPADSEKLQIQAWATIIKSSYIVWYKDAQKNKIPYTILNIIKYAGAVYFDEINDSRNVSPETIISACISHIIILVERILKHKENEANNV